MSHFYSQVYPAVCMKNAELHVDFDPPAAADQSSGGYLPIARAPLEHTSLAGSGGSKAGYEHKYTQHIRAHIFTLARAYFPYTHTLIHGGLRRLQGRVRT